MDSSTARKHTDQGEGSGWSLQSGAHMLPDGRTRFRVWAPRSRQASLLLADGRGTPMEPIGGGEFELTLRAPAGTGYRYVLDRGVPLPDPVSRWQPEGVHGPSRVVDPAAFLWHDAGWRGPALERYVMYELHVGTFTPEGTFAAAIAKLPHLRELGVTAVEIMPVAEFPGGRNWGYDGVQPFAPQSSYGGPEQLKRLIDACHGAGLAVVMDVVYNHLGPEGNYLDAFAPYFSGTERTPWGAALNFDGPDSEFVRRYFTDNALYWLTEFHMDALRLDAIGDIVDRGSFHVLSELRQRFHAEAARLGRPAYLIGESDMNDPVVIDPAHRGAWGLDAQWSNDFHHAVHSILTGNRKGYFTDFGRVADLAKSLDTGFVLDGRHSRYRKRRHGKPSAGRPGKQFVIYLQNHDQVANASHGLRHGALLPPAQQKLAAALLLCAPCVPLLFMGQEYGEIAPFHYFTSHGDAGLARLVTEGRRAEIEEFWSGQAFADPQAPETFAASRLNWELPEQPRHRALLDWYRRLIALRRVHPALGNCRMDLTQVRYHERARWITVERGDPSGEAAVLICNLSGKHRHVPLSGAEGHWRRELWSGEPDGGQAGGAGSSGAASNGAGEPPAELHAEFDGGAASHRNVPLEGWGAVLYLRGVRT